MASTSRAPTTSLPSYHLPFPSLPLILTGSTPFTHTTHAFPPFYPTAARHGMAWPDRQLAWDWGQEFSSSLSSSSLLLVNGWRHLQAREASRRGGGALGQGVKTLQTAGSHCMHHLPCLHYHRHAHSRRAGFLTAHACTHSLPVSFWEGDLGGGLEQAQPSCPGACLQAVTACETLPGRRTGEEAVAASRRAASSILPTCHLVSPWLFLERRRGKWRREEEEAFDMTPPSLSHLSIYLSLFIYFIHIYM